MGNWQKYRGGRLCAIKNCTTKLTKRHKGNVCRNCIEKIRRDNGIK